MDKASKEKFLKKLQKSVRSFRFSLATTPRATRGIIILVSFCAFVFLVAVLSPSHSSELQYILPGDLDPPYLETPSRICPAHAQNKLRKVLSSVSNPFMTAMRINFNTAGNGAAPRQDGMIYRFNPSILPLPPNAPHPYIGFAAHSKGNTFELYACYLARGQKKVSKRLGLQCATEPQLIEIATVESGECNEHLYFGLRKGPQTPRVFLAPDGTPILTYSANSEADCIGVWMVDARVAYPPLMEWFPNPPLQYAEPVELRRPGKKLEMEQNWTFMFERNKTFIQQDLYPRTYSSIGWQNRNLAPKSFKCVNALTQNREEVVLRQATNTLRLSLCNWPCTATEANTVLISIIHVKYKEGYRPYYERRVLVTAAQFPFDVIGISPPLVYTGTDEQNVLYTTSLTWDSRQSPRKDRENVYSMDKSKYAIKSVESEDGHTPDQEETLEEPTKVKVEKRETALEKKMRKLHEKQEELADKTKFREYTIENPQLSGIESDYYHGYLNDVVLIGFGIEDREAAVLDVRAADLVECLKKCVD
ncbi:hypothetical protein V1525DRAFT_396539 [Lipomyces kononenkoae]|uniref:Uncharacterized protein n=1 Tax=Lipomyces kononenkoae TaxID=34357 RepID=A0ACC3T8V6_LIPKO